MPLANKDATNAIDRVNPDQEIVDFPPKIAQRKPSMTPIIGFKE
jgi:hypothetical protein